MLPVVLHIPHASIVIPEHIRRRFELTDEELAAELLRMTDRYTDELFSGSVGQSEIVYPVSRLVVDPERFKDDAREPSARVGMGVIYTKTSTGRTLRREPSAAERRLLLGRFYDPHHQKLTEAVDKELRRNTACLVIDCHSFPTEPVPFEPPADGERPEICIGTDAFHTPPGLRDAALAAFQEEFSSVRVNFPFSGALVPLKRYRKDRRVSAIMIEIARWLFQNEATGERLPQFAAVRDRVRRCVFKMYASFVSSTRRQASSKGEESIALFGGSYINGPDVDLATWCGLDLTDNQSYAVYDDYSPTRLLEERCPAAIVEIDEQDDEAGPGLGDTHYTVWGCPQEVKQQLCEAIMDIVLYRPG